LQRASSKSENFVEISHTKEARKNVKIIGNIKVVTKEEEIVRKPFFAKCLQRSLDNTLRNYISFLQRRGRLFFQVAGCLARQTNLLRWSISP
jgi:hypothetical protein